VITAISVGGMDAWERDIEIPATYGVYMPIADSIGPGGIMRAFRHIPVLVSVARDLEAVSPGAWLFNYSNPLTSNCIAVNRATRIKTAGLCTCSSVPRRPDYLANYGGVAAEDLAMPAPSAGLNHCAAILQLKLKDGRDAFPLIRAAATQPVVKWGLETYNILPYCWTHWTEFYPQFTRLDEPYRGRLQGLKTRYANAVHDMVGERARAQRWEDLAGRLARGEQAFSTDVLPKDEAVQVVDIMEALIRGRNEVHVVNVPNRGAIDNLPYDAIVEVSSLVGSYGIQPLHVGPLPEPVAAMLRLHITAQELTVQAALSGDRKLALQAFLADPQVAMALTPEEAGKLLDELLKAHAPHLPQFA